jgi:CRP/FNR family transcriptional regulator
MMPQAAMSNPCQDCPTRPLCLACDLDGSALDQLANCVRPGTPLHKGDFLYRAGDEGNRCYVVRSGVFKTFTLTPGGDEYVVGFHYPGDLVGLAGQAAGRHTDSAVALETSTACRVAQADLPKLWEIGSGPSLMRLLGDSQHLAATDHINLGQARADARVAGFLLQLSRRLGRMGRDRRILHVPMSRTDLSNYLGMTLECLSRVLGRFVRAGLVSTRRGEIVIERHAALEALALHLPEGHGP